MKRLTLLPMLAMLMLFFSCKQQETETPELVKVEGFEQPDWGGMSVVSEDNDTARQMFDALWAEMETLHKEMESWTQDALTPKQIEKIYRGIYTNAEIFYTDPNNSKNAMLKLIDLLSTYTKPLGLDSVLFFREWQNGNRVSLAGARQPLDSNADTIQPHVVILPPQPDDTVRFNFVYDKVYSSEPYTHVVAYEQDNMLVPIFINHDLTDHSPSTSPDLHAHRHYVAHNFGLALDDQKYIDFWEKVNGVVDPVIEEPFDHKTTYLHCHEPDGRVIQGAGNCAADLTASNDPIFVQPRQNINPVWGKYFDDPLITMLPVRPDNPSGTRPWKVKNVKVMGVTYLREMTVDGTKTLWPVKPQYFAFDSAME